jgi:uncharacterized membrane protein YfcA
VTAGLTLAGALTGAVCGLLALAPLLISHWLRPNPDYYFATYSEIAPWAAGAGAALGAVCGPTLAWSLLRHVSLWRVILWTAVGTVVGSFAGWAANTNPISPGLPAIFGGAILGMIVAGVGLRRRARKTSNVDRREAAT